MEQSPNISTESMNRRQRARVQATGIIIQALHDGPMPWPRQQTPDPIPMGIEEKGWTDMGEYLERWI